MKTSPISRTHTAFTLLEVIVGLVLMGSLVASALVAMASHQHAMVLAKHKIEAAQIADTLLTQWYEFEGDIPGRGQGVVTGSIPWVWRTQRIDSRIVCGVPVNVIRLDIIGQTGENEPVVLSSVELLQAPGTQG